jgi:hypothetical protein
MFYKEKKSMFFLRSIQKLKYNVRTKYKIFECLNLVAYIVTTKLQNLITCGNCRKIFPEVLCRTGEGHNVSVFH